MRPFEALIEAGGLILWLPPSNVDDPKKDTPFLAALRARRDALLAYADGLGPEPDPAWSFDAALTLRTGADPSEPREPPSAFADIRDENEKGTVDF